MTTAKTRRAMVGAMAFLVAGAMACAEGTTGTGQETPTPPLLVNLEGDVLEAPAAATGRWSSFGIEFGTLVDIEVDNDEWEIVLADNGFNLRPPYREADGEDAEVVLTLEVEVEAQTVTTDITVQRLGLKWERLSSGAGLPPGREYFAWWPDPENEDRAWLMGGFHYEPVQFTPANDLWSLDLTTDTWTDHGSDNTALKGGGATVATDDTGASYRFGGLTNDEDGDLAIPFALAQFDNEARTFSDIDPAGAPREGLYQAAFFWEESRQVFMVVGGLQASGEDAVNVSAFDPAANSWTSVAVEGDEALPAPVPPGRAGFSWTFLPQQHRFFMFGGDAGGGNACNCLNDTWALDFEADTPRWTYLATDEIPRERRNAAYGLDATGERMFVFGGTPNGAETAQGVWALDLTRGEEEWTRIGSLEGEGPVARTSGGVFFDRVRDRLLMGFGNNGQGVQTNLWALDLSAPLE